MFWRGLIELNAWPAWRAVKVDDTTVGVAEGVNAGAWSIGVAVSGNVFGASLEEAQAMPPAEFARRRAAAYEALEEAGAHCVVDSVADLPPALAPIEGTAGARRAALSSSARGLLRAVRRSCGSATLLSRAPWRDLCGFVGAYGDRESVSSTSAARDRSLAASAGVDDGRMDERRIGEPFGRGVNFQFRLDDVDQRLRPGAAN